MKDITWGEGRLRVKPPGKPKKITEAHFAEVLGASPWVTPFEAWCRCTRMYEKPFEGNKYTNAGTVIEPRVFDFLRNQLGFGERLITPTEKYGEEYFRKMHGDFYHNDPIFGGMWDALIVGDDGMPEYVVEVKTVRVDGRGGGLEVRWRGGEAPHYKALQASLYAYLLGVDKVMMVGVTLEDGKGDYEHPELVTPSFSNNNVYIDEFSVLDRYPQFPLYLEQAKVWWREHVLTGVSPPYDEKRDAEILAALRTNYVTPDGDDIASLVAEAECLKDEVDSMTAAVKDAANRLKEVTQRIGAYAETQFRDGDTKVQFSGTKYKWTMSKVTQTEINKEALLAAGLFDIFTQEKTIFRLTSSLIKEE